MKPPLPPSEVSAHIRAIVERMRDARLRPHLPVPPPTAVPPPPPRQDRPEDHQP